MRSTYYPGTKQGPLYVWKWTFSFTTIVFTSGGCQETQWPDHLASYLRYTQITSESAPILRTFCMASIQDCFVLSSSAQISNSFPLTPQVTRNILGFFGESAFLTFTSFVFLFIIIPPCAEQAKFITHIYIHTYILPYQVWGRIMGELKEKVC